LKKENRGDLGWVLIDGRGRENPDSMGVSVSVKLDAGERKRRVGKRDRKKALTEVGRLIVCAPSPVLPVRGDKKR